MIPLIFAPIYSQLELPARHRFPVAKYQQLYNQLVARGAKPAQFVRPVPLDYRRIENALCPRYVSRFINGEIDREAMRRIGFPWSEQLVERTLTAVAGTILAGVLSLDRGKAINLTGGYHHAFYDYGAGFCIINDLYLSALNLLTKPAINRVLIFDCDVHQGDGTAALAQDHEDIFTVSVHGEKNFPFRKQVSDIDVPLPKGTGDDLYLEKVEQSLRMAVNTFKPDAVIYDAGVDIHCDDDLGHFEVSNEGILARDQLVFEACDRAGLPVSAVIGGGYQRDIQALVNLHELLFQAAKAV